MRCHLLPSCGLAPADAGCSSSSLGPPYVYSGLRNPSFKATSWLGPTPVPRRWTRRRWPRRRERFGSLQALAQKGFFEGWDDETNKNDSNDNNNDHDRVNNEDDKKNNNHSTNKDPTLCDIHESHGSGSKKEAPFLVGPC